ncbi:hypothetical protein Acr_21g0005500 [Actinidia rufa]|uniref:Transposase (putative) gypsy type domain-containing protein n=1 Tax=Actinidia rufa TaxID=165716 RepID=A0A7J0GGV1_9ERIC|nr:hypothetical protein Acr_21g0005500 [Actinidia rufa]
MSKRFKLSDLTKVVAQKAATSASKGVVISEGSETTSDKSKGKQVAQLPESKKAKIDTRVSEAPVRPPIASGEGSSVKQTLGETLGPQASVMASAATTEKILTGVILPADKEKVDRLTFDQVVTKFLHVLGQGVILGSLLSPFAAGISLKGALAEEKAKGKKLSEDADARDKVIVRLEARISELEKSQSLTQGRIIAAFKESDDFLEAYPDLSVDLEDVEMDHEFLAKEEAEAEKGAAEEGAAGVERQSQRTHPRSHVDGSTVPFMSSKTNLGNEGSEQSLPSWISDHLGRKSYIDETNQSPSLNWTISEQRIHFPQGYDFGFLGMAKQILSARQGEVAFYEAAFLAGLRLPIHPTIREMLIHYKICPAQLSPNAWRSVICSLVIWRHFKREAREELASRISEQRKGMEDEVLFCLGGRVGSSPRAWPPAIVLHEFPDLGERQRTETIFGKIEPGGYFEVSKVLGSRTFKKHFAFGCTALSSSGGDNTTSGDDAMSARVGAPALGEKNRRIRIYDVGCFCGSEVAHWGDSGFRQEKRWSCSPLLLPSVAREHLHDIDFHMARADSAELELVKAQKRAVKTENRLIELSEEGLGSKPGAEVDDLKATVAELTNKLAKAKELAIEDFKASGNLRRLLQILLQHTSVRDLSSARGSFSINSPTLVSTWRIWRWTQVLPKKKRR